MPVKPDSRQQRSKTCLPQAWAATMAEVIGKMESPHLPELLIRSLRTLVAFEYAIVFVYRGKERPVHVYDTFPNQRAKQGVINYVEQTYVLNPFYNAYRRGLKSGVYRMSDLAPDGFSRARYFSKYKVYVSPSEEIGYLTADWPPGRKELCVALAIQSGGCAAVSLQRKGIKGVFSDEEINTLGFTLPLLTASFDRYWEKNRAARVASYGDSSPSTAFESFGSGRLSPREQEIAQLLLRGHSGLSVSLQLSISYTTVKTHRKHIYAKLGIASHFELFSLFLDSMDEKDNGNELTSSSRRIYGEGMPKR